MAQPRNLARPPIVEALVDLRTSIPGDRASFSVLAKQLQDKFPSFPILGEQIIIEGKIVFHIDRLNQPKAPINPQEFNGVRLANKDKTLHAQVRPDGFALNNLTPYIGGDQLIDQALEIWEWLITNKKVKAVPQVGLLYLNQLDIPIKSGEKILDYFAKPPEIPGGLASSPRSLSEFHWSVVGHDTDSNSNIKIVQRLQPPRKTSQYPKTTISVGVYRTGSFSTDVDSLRKILHSLRKLKNDLFFSLLTERTVSLYE